MDTPARVDVVTEGFAGYQPARVLPPDSGGEVEIMLVTRRTIFLEGRDEP
jgi:hypothetical protein